MADETIRKIEEAGLIAVLTVSDPDRAVPLAQALLEGGVRAMELTLRTPRALDCLDRIVSEAPEMLAGVGTVIRPEQVREAKARGAAFAVAPGTNRRVLDAAGEAGLFFAPGVATPSDMETALEYDCRLMKFFPAEPSGGLAYLRSMAAPYRYLNVRFIPLGGLHQENFQTYLADPLIAAVGGSWLAKEEEIAAAAWDAIRARAAEAVERMRERPRHRDERSR